MTCGTCERALRRPLWPIGTGHRSRAQGPIRSGSAALLLRVEQGDPAQPLRPAFWLPALVEPAERVTTAFYDSTLVKALDALFSIFCCPSFASHFLVVQDPAIAVEARSIHVGDDASQPSIRRPAWRARPDPICVALGNRYSNVPHLLCRLRCNQAVVRARSLQLANSCSFAKPLFRFASAPGPSTAPRPAGSRHDSGSATVRSPGAWPPPRS